MELMINQIEELVKSEKPNFVVFEDVQKQQSLAVYKQLAQFQGIVMKLLFDYDLGFNIVEPSKWRSFSGIKGKKRNEQKQNAIKFIEDKYGILVPEDEAEAICIGEWSCKNITCN